MSSSTRGEVVCKYCLLLSLNDDESGEERQDNGGQQGDSAEDDVNCRGGQEGEQAGPRHSAQRAEPSQPWVPNRGLGPKFQPPMGRPHIINTFPAAYFRLTPRD